MVGYVGVPHGVELPIGEMFFRNKGVRGGSAPARAYIPELLDDVLEGRINPGRVLDYETDLDGIADAYAAMDERRAIKSLVRVGTPVMSAWTDDELRRIGAPTSWSIAAVRRNGELRRPRRSGPSASATTSTCAPPTAPAVAGTASPAPAIRRISQLAASSATSPSRTPSIGARPGRCRAYRSKYGARYASIVDALVDA